MGVEYKNGNRYVCNFAARSQGAPLCQHLPADPIDVRVVAAFFDAVSPAELDAWTRARDTGRQAAEARERAEAQQIERLRYEALLAERQFNRVDPDNRLVAAELEQRWEAALRELRRAEDGLARRRAEQARPEALTPQERGDFLALSSGLPDLWQQPGMSRADKKALLRCLIDKVVLQRVTADRISIRVVWRGGEVSEMDVEPAVHSLHALTRGAELQTRLLDLAWQGFDDATIATMLTKEGHRSARRDYIPVRTVQILRQHHRILRQSWTGWPRTVPGWLTIREVAAQLQVSRHWIVRRINDGTITITRNATGRQYLFPDTTATLAALQELKSGVRKHLSIEQVANK